MRVTIAGYLTDHKSRVLLRQPGAAELTPVVASLEPGILPAETLARAFRQATGLIVLPVRLVGLYFVARDGGELTLSYRCALRGGELRPPEGQPPAGYFDTTPLPRGLGDIHRRPLDDALRHSGGPATLAQLGGLRMRLRRTTAESAGPSTDWTAAARLVAADNRGQVVWARDAAGLWRLPFAAVAPGEAPWTAAARLQRQLGLQRGGSLALRLIDLAAGRPALTFVFATALDEAVEPGESLRLAAPDPADPQFDPADAAPAAEALAGPEDTVARLAP